MATVAEQLRAARQAAGLSQQEVAQRTRMRADRVGAVEAGNYEAFTAPVYIRGFVRTYARLVRADEGAVMTALEAELAKSPRFREHPSLTGGGSGVLDQVMLRLSQVPWRFVLPVGLLVVVLVGATWAYRAFEQVKSGDPVYGLEPLMYQPANDVQAEALPVPSPGR